MPLHRLTISYERIHTMDDVRVPRIAIMVEDGDENEKPSRRNSDRNRLLSVVGVILIITLGAMMTQAHATISYFNDTESSLGNSLRAGSLDFTVTPAHMDAYVGEVNGESATVIPVMIPGSGSFPIAYSVTVEKTAGADAFCSGLQANATTTPFTYSGSLLSLATGTTTIPGPWSLEISLPPNAPGIVDGDTCSVDLVYSGWNDLGQQGNGYQDQQRVSILISAGLDDDVATTTATSTDLRIAPPEPNATTSPEVLGTSTSSILPNALGTLPAGGGGSSLPPATDPIVTTANITASTTDPVVATTTDSTASSTGSTGSPQPNPGEATTTDPVVTASSTDTTSTIDDSTTTPPVTPPTNDPAPANTTPSIDTNGDDSTPPVPPSTDSAPAADSAPAPSTDAASQ